MIPRRGLNHWYHSVSNLPKPLKIHNNILYYHPTMLGCSCCRTTDNEVTVSFTTTWELSGNSQIGSIFFFAILCRVYVQAAPNWSWGHSNMITEDQHSQLQNAAHQYQHSSFGHPEFEDAVSLRWQLHRGGGDKVDVLLERAHQLLQESGGEWFDCREAYAMTLTLDQIRHLSCSKVLICNSISVLHGSNIWCDCVLINQPSGGQTP